MINSRLVASLFHIGIALSRALINQRDGAMKTKNLYQEVSYHLSPSTSIANSLALYSIATIYENQD